MAVFSDTKNPGETMVRLNSRRWMGLAAVAVLAMASCGVTTTTPHRWRERCPRGVVGGDDGRDDSRTTAGRRQGRRPGRRAPPRRAQSSGGGGEGRELIIARDMDLTRSTRSGPTATRARSS